MNAQTIRGGLRCLLVVVASLVAVGALSACGDSVVTRARLERSLPQTFANLYVQQAKILGHRDVTADSLGAHAYCDKGGAKVADSGPGADWTCLMTWRDPNVPLPEGTGKFELNVHSNDCYTASGPSKLVGLLAITDTHGNDVPNPVFEFDSCFDPGSSNARPQPSGTPAVLTLPTGTVTPDDKGQVGPKLTCSPGATGGCAGTLTAKLGRATIGTVRYQLAPGSANTFPFPLSGAGSKDGAMISLSAAPLIGTVRDGPTSLRVSSR